jgi:Ca2+-dependent lipid-binding protein
MKCIIRVRHQNDDSSGQISYEELGMVELSFHQMLSAGMTLTNQTTRPLKKCSSMKRVDGFLKLSASIVTNTATTNESSSSSDPTRLFETAEIAPNPLPATPSVAPIVPSTSSSSSSSPNQSGRLTVKVCRATIALITPDPIGRSGQYVRLNIGRQEFKTRVVTSAGDHPTWEEEFVFDISDTEPRDGSF